MGTSARASFSRHRANPARARGEKSANSEPEATWTVGGIGGCRIKLAPHSSIDERIQAIAGRQRGRASRAQLLAAGIHRSAIFRRIRDGRLVRVHSAVYALPQTEELPLAPETAALLACGDGAILSHHSAATLWGLRPGTTRPVHVTIPGHRGCPAPDGVTVHRSVTLANDDVRARHGLPITSPARTILDVSATLPDRDIERLLDEGLFTLRIVTLAETKEVAARAGQHPGRSRLARVAANHTHSTRTDSRPEETLLRLIRAAGLPAPQTQAPALDYRLDLFWPGLRLAVEVDAYGTHGSPARFEADRRRDARLLTEMGIVVVRLTKAMIEQRPLEAVALVARAIGLREAQQR